jgi:hypothetical protein
LQRPLAAIAEGELKEDRRQPEVFRVQGTHGGEELQLDRHRKRCVTVCDLGDGILAGELDLGHTGDDLPKRQA